MGGLRYNNHVAACFRLVSPLKIQQQEQQQQEQGPKRHQPWPSSQLFSAYSSQFQQFGVIYFSEKEVLVCSIGHLQTHKKMLAV